MNPVKPLLKFRAHEAGVRELVCLAQGQLVTVGGDGQVLRWQAQIDQFKKQVVEIPILPLAQAERMSYQDLLERQCGRVLGPLGLEKPLRVFDDALVFLLRRHAGYLGSESPRASPLRCPNKTAVEDPHEEGSNPV